MYYHCPRCRLSFKYALGFIAEFGSEYGNCPVCNTAGVYEKDGARTQDDLNYIEVE